MPECKTCVKVCRVELFCDTRTTLGGFVEQLGVTVYVAALCSSDILIMKTKMF